jgi:hypothetical protein
MVEERPEKTPTGRGLAVYGAGALLLLVVISLMGVMAATRNRTTARVVSHSHAAARTPQATVTPAPASTEVADRWIPIPSEAPADVIAAARKSQLFNLNCPPGADCIQDLSHLGTPAYVHVTGAPRSDHHPDLYLIPILDTNADTLGVAEAALNPAHTAIQVGDLVTYATPLPKGAVTKMGTADAIVALKAQRHTQPAAGKKLELVYFPIDYAAWTTGKLTWNAGGQFPYDPIWLIHGADGKDYIVGTDGHVYTPKDLPVST